MSKPSLCQQMILAALAGDSLGRPFNGMKAGHVEQLLGGMPTGYLSDTVLFADRPERNVLPGAISAAGQRMLAVGSLRGPDSMERDTVARYGALLLEMAGEGPDTGPAAGILRQPGRPLLASVRRWRETYPWAEEDYLTTSQLSRGIAPALLGIACVGFGQAEPVSLALRLARLTHLLPEPLSAAMAMAILAEELLAGRPVKQAQIVACVKSAIARLAEEEARMARALAKTWRQNGIGPAQRRLSWAMEALPSLLREANDPIASTTILASVAEFDPEQPVTHPQHGFAPAGLVWGMYIGLVDRPTPIAVEEILRRGGECSVIAAIACALRMVVHGPEAFPQEYLAGMRGHDVYTRWICGDGSEESRAEWLALESTITAGELALQQRLRDELEKERSRLIAKGKLVEKPDKPKPAPQSPADQAEAPFAPPPHLWLKPGQEEDPRMKRILRATRGKRRIDWKEDRRDKNRDDAASSGDPED